MSDAVRLSVVIPFHNSQRTLDKCLESVERALGGGMEVLLVDDASEDGSAATAGRYPFRLITMDRQRGPAAARNRGADEARGELLLFVDADVVLRPDTIEQLLATYRARPNIAGASAIYSDRPVLPGWFQQFKAMEEACKYAAYRGEKYSAFDTHCGSVRRDVFLELGGFNTAYAGADTEDLEFGHALAATHRNCINPEAVVDHHHACFRRGLWNYCRRSFHWARMFVERPLFDEAVTTRANGASVLLACAAAAAFCGAIVYAPLAWAALAAAVAFVIWNRAFVGLVVRKTRYSAVWLVPVFLLFMFALQIAVGAGALAGLVYGAARRLSP